MIDVIKQQFTEHMSRSDKMNVTREFLQVLCLRIMSQKKMFHQVAFLGGTALRLLYNLRRFSEDLDFSLTGQGGYAFEDISEQIVKEFRLNGLECQTTLKSKNNVDSMMLKFPGLLKELGLSGLSSQNISIKWEADTNPPQGWETLTTILNKQFMFNVVHYDLPSLFAGKLHACFFRTYTKGRDWYDFVWYLTKKIKPNFELLNNAIAQTQGTSLPIDRQNFKDHLLDVVARQDFDFVRKDIERFIEDKHELNVFEQLAIKQLVVTYFQSWPTEK